MFDTQRIQEDFSEAASRYDRYAELQKLVRASAVAMANKCVKPAQHILDLGCGTGALAEEVPWRITGVDVSPGMCDVAKKRVAIVECAAAERLPFADGSFDGIFSSLMLQWSNTPGEVFKESFRVLKNNSYAVFATLADGTLQELKSSFAKLDSLSHVSDFLPAGESIGLAEAAGFTLKQARQDIVVEHYVDVVALMRALKAIGAGHKQNARRKSLMTPRQLALLEQSYRHNHSDSQGLVASWQVLLLVLRKE